MSAILNPRLAQFATPTLAAGEFTTLVVDGSGNLKVVGSFTPSGTNTPTDNFPNPTDCVPVQAFMMGWDGATWDRLTSTAGALNVAGTFTASGSNTPSDAFANPTNALPTQSFNMGFNGTTWDRLRSGQLGTISAATAGEILNVLPSARFLTTAPTLTNGQSTELQATTSGNLKTAEQSAAFDNTNNVVVTQNKALSVATYTPSLFQNLAANATLNVKSSAGNVFSVYCRNRNATTDLYLQLHNTTTTPGAGATPLLTFFVPFNAAIVIGSDFFTEQGINFSTGIAFGISTTESTYTAGTSTDQTTQITYK